MTSDHEPRHDRPTSEGPPEDQTDLERHDESAQGGDAQAAGTIQEREAVAQDRDDLFEDDADDEDDR